MSKPRLSRWIVSSYETEADIAAEVAALSGMVEVVGLRLDAEILVVTSSIKVGPQLLAQTPSARLVLTTTSGASGCRGGGEPVHAGGRTALCGFPACFGTEGRLGSC